MPRTATNTGFKSLCPCCPFSSMINGVPRSDNVRRHCLKMHKTIPWDYRDTFGNALNQVTPTLGIKYNPTTGKYGSWGFCFKCGSHIACGMPNVASKMATVTTHFCAPKQEREKRSGGVSAPREKRTMTASASIEDVLKRIGADIELDDDLNMDLEKTIRLNKGRLGADSLWNDLKTDKKYGKRWRDEEDEMRQEHADDEDIPAFSPKAVIEKVMMSEESAVKHAQKCRRDANDLRKEKAQLEEDLEKVKERSAEKDERIKTMEAHINFLMANQKGDGPDVIDHV